jgi:GNAT superfamily N-acetyltransferase
VLRYHRDWVKFARESGPVSSARTSLRIAPLGSADAEAGAALVAAAFDMPRAAVALLSTLAGRPRWHIFAAYDEERPVAVAGLYVSGQTAYLAFGATAPSHRKRGAQSALIERRLRVAFALGARRVVSETGRATGDDPQHSYGNLIRAGLAPLCTRTNWVPRGVRW